MSASVLVVEDDLAIREIVAEILEDAGYMVRVASDGHAALALLRAGSPLPGLIFADLLMPGMDGATFRKAQLDDPQLAEIPVVTMSALNEGGEMSHSLESVAYLAKPPDRATILELAKRFCSPDRRPGKS